MNGFNVERTLKEYLRRIRVKLKIRMEINFYSICTCNIILNSDSAKILRKYSRRV